MIVLNETPIKVSAFPNSEMHLLRSEIIKALNYTRSNKLEFKWTSDSDLIELMIVKRYIDDMLSCHHVKIVDLYVMYMPYSRMDRNTVEVFSLKYIAEFMNNLSFNSVTVYDTHSDVTPALLNNCSTIDKTMVYFNKCARAIGFNRSKDFVLLPDAGAQKRYHLLTDLNLLLGYKSRNLSTGKIEKYGFLDLSDGFNSCSRVIIVDDLCSRGGTFDMAAKALKNRRDVLVYLIVGHCEQTVFSGNLLKDDSPIEKIFTTNSMKRDHHEKIISMEEL